MRKRAKDKHAPMDDRVYELRFGEHSGSRSVEPLPTESPRRTDDGICLVCTDQKQKQFCVGRDKQGGRKG